MVGQARRAWDEMAGFNSYACLALVCNSSEAIASFCEVHQLTQPT